jgi:hypothetical protein
VVYLPVAGPLTSGAAFKLIVFVMRVLQ